jgi:HSP20 family protein
MSDDEILKGIKKTHEKMEKVFRGIFSESFPFSARGEWIPPCDVYETEKDFIVLIEIAGINKEDLKITLTENYLNIKGFREDPSKADGKRNYYHMELNFGPFEMSIYIPMVIDMENATVDYERGLLKIILPKQEKSKKEKIIDIE